MGEWRGIFLLSPWGEAVIAILFSRAPHGVRDRLHEAVDRHAQRLESDDAAEADG